MLAARLVVLCLAIRFSAAAQDSSERPQIIFERAVSDFKAGRIAESVTGFDRVAALLPAQAPHLWQRGIALYYAGRYKDCRAQFESHRKVNPDDVENAAWHFLCVARAESPETAKAALLPVGPDPRVPMQEIYRMFRGELKPEAVLAASGTRPESQFYAHLYVGLYAEAMNNTGLATQQIRIAADDRFRIGGYMHDVARVHSNRLMRASTSAPDPAVWTFDRLDRIGGLASTILGQPRLIDTAAGKAVEFDGVDDAIFVDVHPLAGAETFTWEVLFRPYRGGAPEQRFFHLQERDPQTGADTPTRLLLETRIIGDQWCLDSFANTPQGSKALIDRTKLHALDAWHHVAMVYDGRQLRHYVDGKLQGAAEVRLSPQGNGHSSIGVRINRRDYFKGAIRLSRMTRRALTPDAFLPLPVK